MKQRACGSPGSPFLGDEIAMSLRRKDRVKLQQANIKSDHSEFARILFGCHNNPHWQHIKLPPVSAHDLGSVLVVCPTDPDASSQLDKDLRREKLKLVVSADLLPSSTGTVTLPVYKCPACGESGPMTVYEWDPAVPAQVEQEFVRVLTSMGVGPSAHEIAGEILHRCSRTLAGEHVEKVLQDIRLRRQTHLSGPATYDDNRCVSSE